MASMAHSLETVHLVGATAPIYCLSPETLVEILKSHRWKHADIVLPPALRHHLFAIPNSYSFLQLVSLYIRWDQQGEPVYGPGTTSVFSSVPQLSIVHLEWIFSPQNIDMWRKYLSPG